MKTMCCSVGQSVRSRSVLVFTLLFFVLFFRSSVCLLDYTYEWDLGIDLDFEEEIEEEIPCKEPRQVKNGDTVVWGDGLLLEYRCKEGSFPVGMTHGACDLYTGTWTIEPPLCLDKGCPNITAPRHGVVNVDNTGGLANIVCRPGYFLIGDNTLMCEEGKWKGVFPLCAGEAEKNEKTKSRKDSKSTAPKYGIGLTLDDSDETCFHHQISPPQIEKAVVDTNYVLNEVRQRYVMVATYTCMGGFVLRNAEASQLFCRNMIWTAGEMPECVAEDDPCELDNAGCHHFCTPQGINRFACSCYDGYGLGKDAKTCVDIDECSIDNGRCDQECHNTDGGYFCSCNAGYTPKSHNCLDIDECTKSGNQCPGPCINTVGSYKCDCNITGYTESASPDYCNDVDECENDNGGCEDMCINRRGSYECRCEMKGWQLDEDGHNCTDIDECERYGSKMCTHGQCFNNVGSYTCVCTDGYTISEKQDACLDVDECTNDNAGCSQVCKNIPGSFECACQEGYVMNLDGFFCDDVDECEQDNGGCEDACNNTLGSFVCSCNMEGKVLSSDGTSCTVCLPSQYYDTETSNCIDCPSFSHTNGSHARAVNDCLCDPGFGGSPADGVNCTDIDECEAGHLVCDHKCINTPGSAYCLCPDGYQLAGDQRSCEDKDECVLSEHNCEHMCENTEGSYACLCNEGYSLRTDGRTCEDIVECELDWVLCSHTCINTPGSYRCGCDEGYVLGENGMYCSEISQCDAPRAPLSSSRITVTNLKVETDVDECAAEKSPCEHKCINSEGSFECECDGLGYKLSHDKSSCIDINECMEGENPCPEICSNTIGSFVCDCNRTGYLLHADGIHCIDIDECSQVPSPCPHECINTPGSYQCQCRPGYHHPSKTNQTVCVACKIGYYKADTDDDCVHCPPKSNTTGMGSTSIDQCECVAGYKGNTKHGDLCVDVDECTDGLLMCEQGCVNTNGSAHCICRPGYHLHFDGFSCTDIDECTMLNGGCDDLCVNTPGSYHCQCEGRDAKLGENGRSCEDVNECSSNNHGCEYRCVNTVGGSVCTCPPGFKLMMDGKKCEDINECYNRDAGCTGTCINTPGSYYCECNILGYELYVADGRSCIDIDECLREDSCEDACFNSPGSFTCHCRRPGYTIGVDKRSCVDIDECSGGRICQHECINILGSFRCDCHAGYFKQGHHCTACYKGTYRSKKDSVVSCKRCPSGMSTKRNGAASIQSCQCRDGYHGNPETNDRCQDFNECSRNNGGCEQKCENTIGSFKCSCNEGYILDSDGKTCKPTRCPLLKPPRYGRFRNPTCDVMTKGKHVPVGTKCGFKCRHLLILSGPKGRTCQPDFTWSGTEPRCSALPCQRLPIPKNGFLHPPACLLPRVPFRTRCSFRCNSGFTRVGRSGAKCRGNKKWSGRRKSYAKCVPIKRSPGRG